MSEKTGEKTEEPTQRRLEDALNRGQFPRSQDVQTVFVFGSGLVALYLFGDGMWNQLGEAISFSLQHLHDTPLDGPVLSGYAVSGVMWFGRCLGPFLVSVLASGLIAGALQNRFRTSAEALAWNWGRLDPASGLGRIFSMKAAVPTVISSLKLILIFTLSWSEIRSVIEDPIFSSSVGLNRVAIFLAESLWKISIRVGLVLGFLAAADYGYQWWNNHQAMLMTKEEVKDEMKSSDGNPLIRAARRRRRSIGQMKMLADVPKADVVLVNPTHIAVALHYDRLSMKAPKILAKGIRLNAQRIRQVAERNQIPILENKPLARLIFKYGRVGGEVPAQLYTAVAEVLAWVYRVNRYRYYAKGNVNHAES